MGKVLFLKKSEKEGMLLTSYFRCERFNKSTIKMTCIYMGTTISKSKWSPLEGKKDIEKKYGGMLIYIYACPSIYLSVYIMHI